MKKILIVSFIFLFFSGCTKTSSPLIKKAHACLGTIVEITVADKDKSAEFINNAIKEAFTEIQRVEDLLSRFKSESDISRINADAYVRATKVSEETISLLEKSILFSQLSDGAFDITVYPLMEIWSIVEKDKEQIPTASEVKSTLNRVGCQNIDIIKQEQSVFLAREGMSVDLGGIAKGYAVDRAVSILKQEGIKNALVNAGGDIYALGQADETKKWKVALRRPRKRKDFLTVLELKDKAIATSGDYEKYIKIDGRRYGHIINPKSGYPCTDRPASVTVISEDCLRADALATSIFVLGPEKGINLVNQLKDTEAIVASVEKDKLDIRVSQGLEGRLEFNL